MSESETELRKYLRDLEFPADRTSVLEGAEALDAPESVVESFKTLSGTELFDGPTEILKELSPDA